MRSIESEADRCPATGPEGDDESRIRKRPCHEHQQMLHRRYLLSGRGRDGGNPEDFFDPMATLLEILEYTYDLAGNRRTRVSNPGTETYAYDPGNRLTSVSGPGGVATYSHDADGRLAAIDRDGTPWTLEYTSLDQLTAVREGAATVATFAYDAVGRRLRSGDAAVAGRRIAAAPVTDPTRVQTHLVRAADDSVLAAYAFAHEKPLMRDTPAGGVYYLTDATGSVEPVVQVHFLSLFGGSRRGRR